MIKMYTPIFREEPEIVYLEKSPFLEDNYVTK